MGIFRLVVVGWAYSIADGQIHVTPTRAQTGFTTRKGQRSMYTTICSTVRQILTGYDMSISKPLPPIIIRSPAAALVPPLLVAIAEWTFSSAVVHFSRAAYRFFSNGELHRKSGEILFRESQFGG